MSKQEWNPWQHKHRQRRGESNHELEQGKASLVGFGSSVHAAVEGTADPDTGQGYYSGCAVHVHGGTQHHGDQAEPAELK